MDDAGIDPATSTSDAEVKSEAFLGVIFNCQRSDRGWVVMRDGKTVGHYPNQTIAEREMARLARAVANKGGRAKAVIHKRDGSIASSRSYTKVTTPWLRTRVR